MGDVAVLNSLPEGDAEMQRSVGDLIMSRNKAIKVTFSSRITLYHMLYHEFFIVCSSHQIHKLLDNAIC